MKIKAHLLYYFLFICSAACAQHKELDIKYFSAADYNIQYTGRIDFSNSDTPRFWAPGVYIKVRFSGAYCELFINDEELWGKHNYIEIAVDNNKPYKIQTTGKKNSIIVKDITSSGEHTVTICKNTEANIGYLEFAGIKCKKLLPITDKPSRKIEFIGNSITCGTGSDQSSVPCGKGVWHDQHNAWYSYGPLTARALKAQWQLSAVSGIGLIHSCCNLTITIPQVFDKINMYQDSLPWNFDNYIPDVVTICLGQNDGIQDSVTFCNAYQQFIQQLRDYYPYSTIICLASPMADDTLKNVLRNYLTGIVTTINTRGDENVHYFFFSKRYHNGCDSHPDMQEHEQIATELSSFIKNIKKW